jgi:hypothetical protein
MWIQGVSKESPPDREASRLADVVVWCYPQKYPDERHPLPDAKGIVAISLKDDLITVHNYSKLPERVQNEVKIVR